MRFEGAHATGVAADAMRAGEDAQPRDGFSVVDRVITVYLAILVGAALLGTGAQRRFCIVATGSLLGLFVLTVSTVRRRGWRHPALAAVSYRCATLVAVIGSYLLLRPLLPTARIVAYDETLHRVDTMIFGVEPTLWLDRFVTPARTEWFAFFYLSYFLVLATHILPVMFQNRRDGLLSELGVLLVILYCTGQLLYFVVPAFGPHRYEQFAHALPSGTFYDLVRQTVIAGGAQRDVFPSLHTAAPVALSIFAFRHREHVTGFRWTWPITMFVTGNIVLATMFLRWHYAIDVIAGFSLALIASYFAPLVSARETERRRAQGLGPIWPVLRARDELPGRPSH